jgi:hypothetical protein
MRVHFPTMMMMRIREMNVYNGDNVLDFSSLSFNFCGCSLGLSR